jgi:hypothetical protein
MAHIKTDGRTAHLYKHKGGGRTPVRRYEFSAPVALGSASSCLLASWSSWSS